MAKILLFLRNCRLESIRTKLILLYLLNVTDVIFTLLLLNTGYYSEANVFMQNIIQSPLVSTLLKALLPALLLRFVYIRMCSATKRQLEISNYLVNAAVMFYSAINVSHLVWFALLPLFYLFYMH